MGIFDISCHLNVVSLFFRVNVVVINKTGKRNHLRGKIGDNLLYLAKRYDVEMEGIYLSTVKLTF